MPALAAAHSLYRIVKGVDRRENDSKQSNYSWNSQSSTGNRRATKEADGTTTRAKSKTSNLPEEEASGYVPKSISITHYL